MSNNHLENEKIQVFLRIVLLVLVVVTLYMFKRDSFSYIAFASFTIRDIIIAVVALTLFYYFFILKFPNRFIVTRIALISLMDVGASLWVMHLVGDYALYYPFLMLWYTIGYSMRFGNYLGFITYAYVLIGWLILIYTTPIWRENLPMSFGWFIAFLIIPLYTFYLVHELRVTLKRVHENLDTTMHQAEHDELTQLPNRKHFEKELHNAFAHYKKFALFFIDLDGFKAINDNYGHHIGDNVLVEVAKRLKSFRVFSARLGGDEFVVIVPYKKREELSALAESIVTSIADKCPLLDIEFSASVGIALYPEDADNVYDLKKKSDIAMYEAKESGKNTFTFYSEKINSNNR